MKLLFVSFLAAAAALSAPAQTLEPPPAFLTLQEARRLALKNHPRVAIASLRELIAGEELRRTKAAYFPEATAYGDAVDAGNRNTRILAGGLSNSVIYDRVADGVVLNQTVSDFGQTRNLVSSAKFSARAEAEGARATGAQILLAVDVSYYGALQAQAVLRVAQDTVKARQLLVDQVSALEKNRLRSELDVSFAQVAFEQARLTLQRAEGDEEAAQASLCEALGYQGGAHFNLTDVTEPAPTVPDVDTLITRALADRPELAQLGDQRDAALSAARAAKDRNYPTLAAVGTVGNAVSHDYRLPDKYAVAGLQLNIPLFAGGSYLAEQHEAELRARIADESLRDEADQVSRDVRLAWAGLGTSIQRLQTTEELLVHANQAFSLAQARYKIGSSSIVELSDAQVAATSAQIDEANAKYDELIQKSALDYEIGALK